MKEDPPSTPRISDYVAFYSEHTPFADALVVDGERITYADLHERVEQLSRALLAAGVSRGDRVATLCTPHPDYFVTFLATASIGAIWIGLNPRFRTEELAYVIRDCEPRVLLTRTRIEGRKYDDDIAVMRRSTATLERTIVLDDDPLCAGGELYDEFLLGGESVSPAELAERRAVSGGREPCLIVYTSGSTGQPKGALLCHEAIVAFSLAQNRAWPVSRVRILNYFPINHVGCLIDVSCPALVDGGCIVFMEQFDPAVALRLIGEERLTVWGSVPSVFQMQLALPEAAQCDFSSVELILWEGAAMPEEVITRLLSICPRLATNYGLTETTSAVTIVEPTSELDVLTSTVGYAFAGVEIRLVDPAGNDVPEGAEGEIWTRSIYNMLGYWRRPDETALALLPGGWLRTGDLAVRRPDGRYRIVGRLKEMYKSGGYNVYPREVERVLETHPAVSQAAVVGIPDPLWQEVGVAYVVLRAHATPAALEAHCRDKLANYKVPKRFELRDALPLLPIGKIDKLRLRIDALATAIDHKDPNGTDLRA